MFSVFSDYHSFLKKMLLSAAVIGSVIIKNKSIALNPENELSFFFKGLQKMKTMTGLYESSTDFVYVSG